MNRECPILFLVIPCYNEEQVLPITSCMFENKLKELIEDGKVQKNSKILFVNDGSKDSTWDIICKLAKQSEYIEGMSQSRNRGHQNAVLAGLMEARKYCDITITIDCDGQDDINAMNSMVEEYLCGYEIVYGVRNKRETDTFFKRFTAETFYKLLNWMGVEVVFNHADYRLLSKRVLQELSKFKEVNIFLRGMIPLIGFASTSVYYERHERLAGESHYPLRKMLSLAFDGITSLSIKPIRMITMIGAISAFFSFVGIVWAVIMRVIGNTVSGWASMVGLICLWGGIQLMCIGILGEYIGKIYLETKSRPRYIISERTYSKGDEEE
ncbi:glycosyltransferase [Lachnoclostridium sp. An14]|uniref:glycosyltransferase family 2 protein n=1 Tax=Lachnoclostridium sp. An14 TaxID=1965562 RepID=UPI000B3AF19C|nr:glycosyltransferase family 2 protein [Lachnoclostridium sp. An14]OUQ11115.1 glycosyltransferase [Lachnoclostridium sp. An14]